MVALVFKCTVKKSLSFSYFGYTRKRKANGQQFGRGCAVEPAFKQHKFTPLENNDIVVCCGHILLQIKTLYMASSMMRREY
jgi:hypothetical protein